MVHNGAKGIRITLTPQATLTVMDQVLSSFPRESGLNEHEKGSCQAHQERVGALNPGQKGFACNAKRCTCCCTMHHELINAYVHGVMT